MPSSRSPIARATALDSISLLQAHVSQFPEYARTVISRLDVVVTSTSVERMTAAQFACIQEVRR